MTATVHCVSSLRWLAGDRNRLWEVADVVWVLGEAPRMMTSRLALEVAPSSAPTSRASSTSQLTELPLP